MAILQCMNVISKKTNARRIRAYHEHDTDAAAARSLGLTPITFRQWRAKAGYPAKVVGKPAGVPNRKPYLPADVVAKRIEVYNETDDDAQAAHWLGLTVNGFRRWRVAAGLKAKATKGRPATPEDIDF